MENLALNEVEIPALSEVEMWAYPSLGHSVPSEDGTSFPHSGRALRCNLFGKLSARFARAQFPKKDFHCNSLRKSRFTQNLHKLKKLFLLQLISKFKN